MLSFVRFLSFLFFFMGCCVGAEITVPESEPIKRSRLGPTPSFGIDIDAISKLSPPCTISPGFNGTTPIWVLSSPSEEMTPHVKFFREKTELLEKVNSISSEDRYRHVVAIDFDGVLTTNPRPIPVEQIRFSNEGCEFYQQLIGSGATVLVTSSRFNQQEIIDALKKKGTYPPPLQTETIDGLEFTWSDNVISACSKASKAFELRSEKFEAAIFGYKKHFKKQRANQEEVYPGILSITLIDDQERNIERFTSSDAGALFGVPHPKAKGIVFPPYSAFPPGSDS